MTFTLSPSPLPRLAPEPKIIAAGSSWRKSLELSGHDTLAAIPTYRVRQ